MAAQTYDFRTDSLLDPLPPSQRDELSRFIAKARENGLQTSDYYTIRDLQELSGCKDRALTVLLTCLFLALREGSVCMDLARDALVRRLDGVLDRERAQRAADEIRSALDGPSCFSELIGDSADSGKPVVRRTVGGRDLLYFQKFLRHENQLSTLLHQRLAADSTAAPAPAQAAAFAEVIAAHAKKGIRFSDEQKLAIGLALLRKLAVISGGPGTGKTSAVVAILHCLVRNGVQPERIMLGCPTGRAAQRLTESIRAGAADIGAAAAALSSLRAQTLHRLLGYSGASGKFFYRHENPLPADVLIVDEVSMMDIVLMSRFLEAAPPSARIILLGDKDQLPSVDAGSVLADLMPTGGQPAYSAQMRAQLRTLTGIDTSVTDARAAELAESVAILTANFRSQTHITEVAAQINGLGADDRAKADAIVAKLPTFSLVSAKDQAPSWPALKSLHVDGHAKDGGCFRLDLPHKIQAWRDVLDAWARHHYIDSVGRARSYPDLVRDTVLPAGDAIGDTQEPDIAQIFSIVNGARVLTLLREGNWGCEGVNAYLAQFMQPHATARTTARLFPGAPVLVTSNDYHHELFNGDVGVALRNSEGALQAVFERQDDNGRIGYLALPIDLLPGHELAFAMTVHKSQGSEYGQVLLALPPEGGQRLQNRQLIYTAITRARDLAVCFGSKEALSAAIGRTIERCSGLQL